MLLCIYRHFGVLCLFGGSLRYGFFDRLERTVLPAHFLWIINPPWLGYGSRLFLSIPTYCLEGDSLQRLGASSLLHFKSNIITLAHLGFKYPLRSGVRFGFGVEVKNGVEHQWVEKRLCCVKLVALCGSMLCSCGWLHTSCTCLCRVVSSVSGL